MNRKEFKKYCEEFDENITDNLDSSKFKVACSKCGSKEVSILYNGKEMAMGSEYTGAYTSQNFNLVFKCIECGNAVSLVKDIISGDIKSEEEVEMTKKESLSYKIKVLSWRGDWKNKIIPKDEMLYYLQKDVKITMNKIKIRLVNEGTTKFFTSQQFDPNAMLKIIDEELGEEFK